MSGASTSTTTRVRVYVHDLGARVAEVSDLSMDGFWDLMRDRCDIIGYGREGWMLCVHIRGEVRTYYYLGE